MPKTIFMNKQPPAPNLLPKPSPQPGQKPGAKIRSPQPSPQPKVSPQPKPSPQPKETIQTPVIQPVEIKKEEPVQEPPKELQGGRRVINMMTYIDTPDDDWGVMTPVHKGINNGLNTIQHSSRVNMNDHQIQSDKQLYVLDQDGLNTLISSLVKELSEKFVTKEEVKTLVRNSLQTMVMEQVRPKK